MSDNPFAASDLDPAPGAPDGEAWAEGDVLVTRPTCALPLVCAKCGARDGVAHVAWKSQWVPLWVRLTILVSPLLMLILFLVFRKGFDLRVGLCATHASRRRLATWGGTGGVVLGVLVLVAGLSIEDTALLVAGLVVTVGSLVPLIAWGTLLRPRLVTAERAEFTGAHPELLRAVSR